MTVPTTPLQLSTTSDGEDQYELGVYYKRPLRIVRGAGALVWDDAGNEYIDCVGGIGVANVGHANPRVAAAIAAQATQLITCPGIFHNDVRAHYLTQLATVLPKGMDRIFLCNSGSEAVEAAIKFARLSTGRTGIVATMRGFHGRTYGALSATWEKNYREPFLPLVPDFHHVPYNNIATLDASITDTTAAVLLETLQGEGGIRPATAEFLQAASRLCQERGALLILDEVQCGCGRIGRMWAFEHVNVVPDILCIAKGMAGGVPMGACCLGDRVGTIPTGVHGTTFGGNPLACAAAIATLAELQECDLPANASAMGTRLLNYFNELATQTPLIREVRGQGLMIGLELCERVQPYAICDRLIL